MGGFTTRRRSCAAAIPVPSCRGLPGAALVRDWASSRPQVDGHRILADVTPAFVALLSGRCWGRPGQPCPCLATHWAAYSVPGVLLVHGTINAS
jgi:hypothetical protein